ncbi:hypothetical protein J3R82DRAFT_3176 [Butyriboletus roseoflavus]|nr:hypothetical protein J3R82DRAFT_3176 [Butyriboletus roseoflavus]
MLTGGLGDLRNISRKTWSKSADDLRSFPDLSHATVDVSFQHRIQEYRNRSNSSATLHPTSFANNAIPASPTFQSVPSAAANISNSPPDDSLILNEPNISISVSSPVSEGFVLPDDSPPTPNARMHSFAPRLPTKLSASKLGLSPNSPKRKGSGDSMKPLDSDKCSGASMGRGVFPFSLAAPSHKHSAPNLAAQASANQPSSSLLAPPTSNDAPEASKGSVSRRTSQITYNTGFINRLTDPAPMIQAYQRPYSTAANFTLAKGWKPYKTELKGSKLYFYKPPSDRSAAIKELFPTDIVPPTIEDEVAAESEVLEEVGRSGKGREDGFGSIGRKKRAYWGRKTHPELVLCSRQRSSAPAAVEITESAERFTDGRSPEWKDFSSAIILCLPPFVDRSKFENEFTRLCSNLVNGAEENTKEVERARVVWMAQEYVRYYGNPSDEPGWQEFASSTIPNSSINPLSINGGVPKSVSTQAIYTPSSKPELGNPADRWYEFDFSESRDILAKTSRWKDNFFNGSARNTGRSVHFYRKATRSSTAAPTASVHRRDGTTAKNLDDARTRWLLSLQTFHRRAFQDLPDNLTAEHVLGADTSQGASDDEIHAELPHSAKFFGSDDHPHWLTRTLLIQILGSDSCSANNSHFDRAARTHSRSEVISIWARVAELCRIAGDECSWKAISAALCSRPVARLTKAWRRADRQSVIAVESWIYPESDGHVATAREPMMTAWGGDTKEQVRYELERARNEMDEYWAAEPLLKAKNIFEGLRTHFALCSRSPVETASLSPDVGKLVSLWEDLSRGEGVQNAFALKFQRYVPSSKGLEMDIDASASVEQFVSLSLAAEPRRKGLFEPFFWSQSTAPPHTHCHPLVPLLFVEPLPTVSLIDRGQVWRGRLESGPTKLTVEELQQLRSIDTSLRPFGQNDASASKDKLLKIGDVDLGGTAIPVYDGELLLVARPDKDPGSASRPASRAPSRPPSSAIETSGRR